MQSVDRVCKIIELVANSEEELGVIELSKEVGLAPSTTHRILKALVDLKYLSQDEITKKYNIGKMLYAISGKIIVDNSLATSGRPFLMELSDVTGETVHFCVIEDYKTYLIEKVKTKKNLTHTSNMGFRDEPYLTAFGKVLLAHLNDDEIEEYIEKTDFIKKTNNTITDKVELKKELKKIKSDGYAIDNEESEEGLYCIAAPIHNKNGEVAAAISISGPTFRIKDNFDKNLGEILSISHEMTTALGWKLSS